LRGEKSVSTFSVGIEINNPGPLVVSESGSLKTVYGKTWPQSDSIEATHPGGLAPKNWKHWAKYSDSTLDTVKSICEALMKRYGIKIIVGHDEIAPGRKFDPGPAFPMQKFRSELGAEGP
jgi:N-acetyl-anhydromuramyl-L-alanine amidase AmpD